MIGNSFRCKKCGGSELQVSLPGWYRPGSFEHVECDAEAEALAWYCEDCLDTVTVIVTTDSDEREDRGRWGLVSQAELDETLRNAVTVTDKES